MICLNGEHSAVSQALLEDVTSLHPRASKTLQHQCLRSFTFTSHASACLSIGCTLDTEALNLLRGRKLKTLMMSSAEVSVPSSWSPPPAHSPEHSRQPGPTCPRRFCPAHTDVWMIFRKSCPVLGLKMKMAPLIGFVVKFPSKV